MQVWADSMLWIHDMAIGLPGSKNDINTLNASDLMVHLLHSPDTGPLHIHGEEFQFYYLLTDSIYPEYPIFVRPITAPMTAAEKKFSQVQESLRKCVERAFGVLVVGA